MGVIEAPQWLLPAFTRSVKAIGATQPPEAIGSAGELLIERWSTPDRRFHNLRHLIDMLARVDELAEESHDPDIMRVACWYHGCVFSSDVEEVIRGNGEFRDITLERPEQGLYWILEHLPGQKILIALALFVGILFYVTSADSGALVMANLSSRIRSARQDAAAWLRIFWAALTGILTIAMLVAGGIPILQQATIVMALPFSGVLILIMYTLWRSLSTEDTYNQALSRADRNRALGFNGSAAGLGEKPRRGRRADQACSVLWGVLGRAGGAQAEELGRVLHLGEALPR